MLRTNIYLEERQTELLDRMASEEGVSRAEIIRRLIDAQLAGSGDLHDDLAAIKSSFGALADDHEQPELTREPDARDEHLDRMWQLGR